MTNSENSDVNQAYGCVVCARLFNAPVIYLPRGESMTCKVTWIGGHCAQDKRQPLVTHNSYSVEKIGASQK